jgi:hypothetical protein
MIYNPPSWNDHSLSGTRQWIWDWILILCRELIPMYFFVLILLPVYYCAQELFSCHHRRNAKHLESSHLNKSFGTCLSEHGVISHFLRLVNVYIIYFFYVWAHIAKASCSKSQLGLRTRCILVPFQWKSQCFLNVTENLQQLRANSGLSEVVVRGSLQGKNSLNIPKG